MKLRYLLIAGLVLIPAICYAQLDRKEVFKSTQVTQTLKRSLDPDGTWRVTFYGEQAVTPSPFPPEGTHFVYFKTDGKFYSLDSAGTETEIGSGAGGGANTALSNLSSVAINTTLLPGTTLIHSLGSQTFKWGGLHVDNMRLGNTALFINDVLDEDNMASDSASVLATQQSIKAYVDSSAAGSGANLFLSNLTSPTAVNQALNPSANNTHDLGSNTFQWRNFFVEGTANIDTLTLQSGALVGEFSIDGTLAGNTDGAVPTEKAVKTYVDSNTASANRFLSNLSTPTAVNQNLLPDSDDNLDLGEGASSQWRNLWLDGTANIDNLKLATGATADEISIDGTLSGNSDNVIPTEQAVKTYSDSGTSTFTNKTYDANGTGNSLSNVDVADLANGTAGQLITWAAGGGPATVATGSSGQILVSNGAGTAPTFQAAGGGAGANTELSNLIATSINRSLIANGNNTFDLGSGAIQWKDLYVDGTGNIDTLTLTTGASIIEFSIDGTLAGDSDTAVPTEKAVKTYVDSVKADRDLSNLQSVAVNISLVPGVDDTISLGTASNEWKDLHIDGTGNIDQLQLDTGVPATSILDEDDLISNSDTALATQQSIKAYVDGNALGANRALDNLLNVAINTTLISDTTNTDDLGSATFQWKDLYIDGTGNIDTLSLDSGVSVTSILDEDTMVSNSATALATQQSIKAYVDNNIVDGGLNTGLSNPDIPINISASNNDAGENNTIFGAFSGVSIALTGDNNTAYGDNSLNAVSTGDNNTGFGVDTLKNSNTQSDNTAIGYHALDSNVTTGQQTAVGSQALSSITTGEKNNALGYKALTLDSTGNNNTAFGWSCLSSVGTGDNNTAVGQDIGTNVSTSADISQMTFVGSEIGGGIMTTNANGATGMGYQALNALTGAQHVAAYGRGALMSLLDGDNNTGIGWGAGGALTIGTDNTFVGVDAGSVGVNIRWNTGMGVDALQNSTSDSSSAFGYKALFAETTGSNDALGYLAGTALTTGTRNVVMGFEALSTSTTSSDSVALGNRALRFAPDGADKNIAIGSNVLLGISMTGVADENIGIGTNALENITTGNANTAIGDNAGNQLSAGQFNVGVGYHALDANLLGSLNTAIGANSLSTDTAFSSCTAVGDDTLNGNNIGDGNTAVGKGAGSGISGSHNTLVGLNAAGAGAVNNVVSIGDSTLGGNLTNAADGAVAVGFSAGTSLSSGQDFVGVGEGAGANTTTGNDNTFIGNAAGSLNISGSDNVAVGDLAMVSNTTTGELTAVGSQALNATTGGQNVGVGYQALTNNTTGSGNTGVGWEVGQDVVTGSNNTLVGEGILNNDGVAAAVSGMTFIGAQTAMGALTTNADNTTGVGFQALSNLTSGANNTVVGSMSGNALTSGQSNTAVGRFSLGARDTEGNNTAIGVLALGNGTSGSFNTAVGGDTAPSYNGSNSVFMGDGALFVNSSTSSTDNIFIGKDAGRLIPASVELADNIAIGSGAMSNNTASAQVTQNIAIGTDSLKLISTGDQNVCIGHDSGSSITTGQSNVVVGDGSGTSNFGTSVNVLLYGPVLQSGSATAVERYVIGHSMSGTTNQRMHIGNNVASITADFNSSATWSFTSDERAKKDIKETEIGLSLLKLIDPITFHFRSTSEYPKDWTSYDYNGGEYTDQRLKYGFSAQNIRAALDANNITDHSVWGEGPDGKQSVGPTALIPHIVVAVKENDARITELETLVAELQAKITAGAEEVVEDLSAGTVPDVIEKELDGLNITGAERAYIHSILIALMGGLGVMVRKYFKKVTSPENGKAG